MPRSETLTLPGAAPIQVQPLGLLSFLQIKNGGAYPSFLTRELVAQIDLEQWYLEMNSEHLGESPLALAAVGSTGSTVLIVPNGEFWCVHEFSISIGLGGAQTINVGCCGFLCTGGPFLQLGRMQSGIANENVRIGIDRKRFLGPGAQLGAQVQSITGGPINASLSVRVSRFRPSA
jgi:hypothetical protein